MKKLWTIAIAGIVAMSFAAATDAATVNRMKATKVINNRIENPTVVTTVNVTLPQVNFSSMNARGTTSYWSYWTEVGKTDYTVNQSTSVAYQMIDGVMTKTITNTTTINSTRTDTNYSQFHYDNDPLVLDINGTGKITAAKNEWLAHTPNFYGEYASKFDFTGDGIADQCEWMSENPDAFLCMPKAGEINGVTELFGNLGGYANGFDKLATLCDADGNGVVEGNELNGIMLWIDSNRNGVSDPGELHQLSEYNVTKLYTDQKNFVGKYETADGQTHTMWSWWPTVAQ
ncbi:MAG: hypothetical protein MJ234_03805 [bacterium]|nr:hypothetical protein [bacterium]